MALPFLAANLGYKAIRDYVVPLFKKGKRRKVVKHSELLKRVPPSVNKKRGASGASTDDTSSQKKLKTVVGDMRKFPRSYKASLRRVRRGRPAAPAKKRFSYTVKRRAYRRRTGFARRKLNTSVADNAILHDKPVRPLNRGGLIRQVDMDNYTISTGAGRWSLYSYFEVHDLVHQNALLQNMYLSQDATVNTLVSPASDNSVFNPQITTTSGTAGQAQTISSGDMRCRVLATNVTLEIANVCNSSVIVELLYLTPKQNCNTSFADDVINAISNPQTKFKEGPTNVAPLVTTQLDGHSDMWDITCDQNFQKGFKVLRRVKFNLGSGDTRRFSKSVKGFTIDGGKLMMLQLSNMNIPGASQNAPITFEKNRTVLLAFRIRGKVTSALEELSATFAPAKIALVMNTEDWTKLKPVKRKVVLQQAYGADLSIQLPAIPPPGLGAIINDEEDAVMGYNQV